MLSPDQIQKLTTPNLLIGTERFRISGQLGQGSFGVVCKAYDRIQGDQVALKLELRKSRLSYLWNESIIYKALEGGVGVPKMRYYGCEFMDVNGRKNVNFMAMELLGKDLWNLRQLPERLRLKTVLEYGVQMISRVEYLHEMGYIHQDIKPDNFVLGTGASCNLVYLIDLGLAQKYVTPTGRHISYRENYPVPGNRSFVSVNGLQFKRVSRRDDLISVGYCFLHFLKPLPWSCCCCITVDQMINMKLSSGIDTLCAGVPPLFADYLRYCMALDFKEKPDYDYLRGLLEAKLAGMQNDKKKIVSKVVKQENVEPIRTRRQGKRSWTLNEGKKDQGNKRQKTKN